MNQFVSPLTVEELPTHPNRTEVPRLHIGPRYRPIKRDKRAWLAIVSQDEPRVHYDEPLVSIIQPVVGH